MGKLINIDNGGTLTDICVIDGDVTVHTKTLTTPYDLSQCLLEGLKKVSQLIYGEVRLVELLLSTDHIRYSTTQGTNAIVERKGPRLGLIVSRNFDIRSFRSTRAEREMFDALVAERVAEFDSSLSWEDLDQEVVTTINRLTAAGANRIVVSLSGPAYRQDEVRFKDTALQKFPRHLLGVVPVLCASDLENDVNSHRRTWTALINAFLHPTMENFLYNAEDILREHYHQHPLQIFRNDGDTARVARTVAVKTLSSGPRGGMEGTLALATHYGFKRVLSMDVGGTTTDIGLVDNGRVATRRHGNVEGIPVSLPLCDIASVGVGGSSIIKGVAGSIKVGPESTGGVPGPACFGIGGQEATITDVFLLNGMIDPKTYFGGAMELDRDRAKKAVQVNIAAPLKMSVEQALDAAEGAWCKKIADSLRDYTTIDADTTLAAFGGAGPFLVTDIADAAGIRRAIIPRLASVFSAFGIGFSDIAHSYQEQLRLASKKAAQAVVEELRQRAERDMYSEGVKFSECLLQWSLVRIHGADETNLQWAPGREMPGTLFEADAVFVCLRAVKPINHASFGSSKQLPPKAAVVSGHRAVRLAKQSDVELPVYQLHKQPPGATANGPCILEEAYFTGRIGSGWTISINANRDVALTCVASEKRK